MYHHIAVGFMKSSETSLDVLAGRPRGGRGVRTLLFYWEPSGRGIVWCPTMVVHGTAGVADAHLWIPTQYMRDYSSQATEAAGPL